MIIINNVLILEQLLNLCNFQDHFESMYIEHDKDNQKLWKACFLLDFIIDCEDFIIQMLK